MKTSTHSILMTVYHCRLSHLRNLAVSRMKDSLNDGREFVGPKRRGKQHNDASGALLLLYSVCFLVNAGQRPEVRTQKVPLRKRPWLSSGFSANSHATMGWHLMEPFRTLRLVPFPGDLAERMLNQWRLLRRSSRDMTGWTIRQDIQVRRRR